MRFKRKRKIANAKIYEDKRDLYCRNGVIRHLLSLFVIKKGVSTICMDYYSIYKCDNLLIYTFTSQNEYSDTDIIRLVEILIDNIYVEFGGHVYQHTVGIPMVLIVPQW